MKKFSLQSWRQKLKYHRKGKRTFLNKLLRKVPADIDAVAEELSPVVWKSIDCLQCANCCKKMTPTYTIKDIKRIAKFLNITTATMKSKWLIYDKKAKEWMNASTPCQFLNPKDHKCSIYEVRPFDCSGFPHLIKKKFKDYGHVHKQNIDYCPAAYSFVEKLESVYTQSKL
ncbi:MAG: YkgJ family cysteine cluster protein [Phycisphaerales bacterium]|nr:YkgJ family cysteine cluster protein [Phycisphaerales bacterium]